MISEVASISSGSSHAPPISCSSSFSSVISTSTAHAFRPSTPDDSIQDDEGAALSGNSTVAGPSAGTLQNILPGLHSRSYLSLLTINSGGSFKTRTRPALNMELDWLCRAIDNHPSLRSACILSSSVYAEQNRLAPPHRCLVLLLQRDRRDEIWLRLDRRPTSRVTLFLSGGDTPANDRVWMLRRLRQVCC